MYVLNVYNIHILSLVQSFNGQRKTAKDSPRILCIRVCSRQGYLQRQ